MRGLPSILSFFRNEFNKLNTGAQISHAIRQLKNCIFLCENVKIFPYFTQRYNGRHNVSRKSVNQYSCMGIRYAKLF